MNDKSFKMCNFQAVKNKIKFNTTETNDKMSKDNRMGYNQ